MIGMKQELPRKTGRPLSFDRDDVLQKAMLTFWRHGYETTSISDLTAAMGVTAPSLYAAFGDKKRLFLAAMQLYAGPPEVLAATVAQAQTARDAAQNMIQSAAIAFTGEATPPGCLLASATASGSAQAADVQSAVAAVRRGVIDQLHRRIVLDVDHGILPPDTPTRPLAEMVVAVIQGLSVLARDGLPRDSLLHIGNAALLGWPAALTGPTVAMPVTKQSFSG